MREVFVAKKSRQIDNRMQSSGHVVSAAEAHAEQVAAKLAARAVSVQGAETKATKEVFLVLLGFLSDTLGASAQSLDAAELRVVAERADDVGLREERDTATEDLVRAAVRVKSMVADALGASGLRSYALEGDTPRVPRDLVSHARSVSGLMTQKPFVVTVDGVTFDSAAMAETLSKKADVLNKALEAMRREEQELADQLGRRDQQVLAWVEEHQGIADSLVGLFRLAGRKDLAERVRPTSRALAGEEITPAETTTSEQPSGEAVPG
ncbi:hypothetical protein [Polyangium fumosum]|uniref:Uncharacterized protein n=1 Tax=Polyangium fumosum TaxID=889272 RepID=A0A4U1ICV7_9BACT|nr:hypothetical protein [Polyangium fumosum]TKC91473.1 hypothetical protein E8A74_50625 [Polyangium fumosum]